MTSDYVDHFVKHEIIGLEVCISKCINTSQKNIKGIVVDETRNTLVINKEDSKKRIAKKYSSFMFKLGGTLVEVEGDSIIGRPEDRIKKKKQKIMVRRTSFDKSKKTR